MTLDPRTSQYLDRLRDDRWTVIATQELAAMTWSGWRSAEDAPLSINQAQVLYDEGLIEIAQRRDAPSRLTLVAIRRRRVDAKRIPWFSRFDHAYGRGPDEAAREMRRHA